jgi:hypothetical protein
MMSIRIKKVRYGIVDDDEKDIRYYIKLLNIILEKIRERKWSDKEFTLALDL